MACNEGIDSADFAAGGIDYGDDPTTPIPDVELQPGEMIDGTTPRVALFLVTMTNESEDDATVHYATSNGEAQAGTHYVNTNGDLTIPAGETEYEILVQILEVTNTEGNLHFNMTLSAPVNCAITGNPTQVVWVHFPRSGTPPPPPPPGDNSYFGFTKPGTVYDQFHPCTYKYACTAASIGAAMSGMYQHATGHDKAFNWKKLYTDEGGCLQGCSNNCNGEKWLPMLRHLRDTGIKEEDGSTFFKAGFQELSRTNGKTHLLDAIKAAIRSEGVVYLCSPWYADLPAKPGWNNCKPCNDYVLQNPLDNGPYGKNTSPGCSNLNSLAEAVFGHCWIFTGWNNNKANGAFEIQSSHGRDWGSDGRGWMPYSYLELTGKWHYYKLTYRGPA